MLHPVAPCLNARSQVVNARVAEDVARSAASHSRPLVVARRACVTTDRASRETRRGGAALHDERRCHVTAPGVFGTLSEFEPTTVYFVSLKASLPEPIIAMAHVVGWRRAAGAGARIEVVSPGLVSSCPSRSRLRRR